MLHAYVADSSVEASQKMPSMKRVLFLGVLRLLPFTTNLWLEPTTCLVTHSHDLANTFYKTFFLVKRRAPLCEVGGAPSSVSNVTLRVGEVVPQG